MSKLTSKVAPEHMRFLKLKSDNTSMDQANESSSDSDDEDGEDSDQEEVKVDVIIILKPTYARTYTYSVRILYDV